MREILDKIGFGIILLGISAIMAFACYNSFHNGDTETAADWIAIVSSLIASCLFFIAGTWRFLELALVLILSELEEE